MSSFRKQGSVEDGYSTPPEPVNLLGEEANPSSTKEPLPPGVRLVLISDTHSRHENMPPLPEGDVLIHAGDFTNTGTIAEVKDFAAWFDSQPFVHRVFIAGNHDTSLDTKYYKDRGHERFHSFGKSTRSAAEISADSVNIVRSATSTYLQDETAVIEFSSESGGDDEGGSTYNSLNIFGSPWSSEFCDWAFNVDRGQPSIDTWARIPRHTDVLITHGPPIGYGDRTQSGFRCGCVDLLQNIRQREQPPRVHIFGHIHEDRGAWHDGKTLFINASTCTFRYRPTNDAITVHLPFDPTLPASIV